MVEEICDRFPDGAIFGRRIAQPSIVVYRMRLPHRLFLVVGRPGVIIFQLIQELPLANVRQKCKPTFKFHVHFRSNPKKAFMSS